MLCVMLNVSRSVVVPVVKDNVCAFKNIHIYFRVGIIHLPLLFQCSFVRLRHRSTAQHRALPLKHDGFFSSSELAQYSHRWHKVCAL